MIARREEWLRARRSGIGGSDIAAVLGVSPWRTPLDVWRDKTAPPDEAQDGEPSEPMYWGLVLEDVVAREYARREGRRVQRVNSLLRLPDRPWAIATIDRAVVAEGRRARPSPHGGLTGADGVLECKTAHAAAAAEWGGAEDAEGIPVHYAAQGMWYLGVTGLEWCDFAVLVGGQRFLVRRLERDEEVIRSMLERAEEFWRRYVVERTPPPPRTSADVLALFPCDNGESLEADAALLAAWNDAAAARQRSKQAEQEFEAAAERIKLALGARSALTLNGSPIATWKGSRPSRKTDWKAVCEEARVPAEIIDRHTVEQPGPRRFILKEKT